MSQGIKKVARCYETYTRGVGYLADVFLLVIRLYWGWSFMAAGWGKLTNLDSTATYFASLGIPFPACNAAVSGGAEFFGGLLLLLGLGTRLVAPVLIINMVVAYVTAHTQEAQALFSHPNDFVTAPPFLYLLVNVIVLIFGPGVISLDTLLKRRMRSCGLCSQPENTPTSVSNAQSPSTAEAELTRRKVCQLTATALGGLVAGALLRGAVKRGDAPANGVAGASKSEPNASTKPASATDAPDAAEKGVAEIAALDAAAPEGIQPSLILNDPHVCRGLNTCKGKGKGGANSCAGQGACATVDSHACNGLNDCKGHGGCGDFPGQNACKGKGACAVKMKKETWTKAREVFEHLMSLKQKPVGQPPG